MNGPVFIYTKLDPSFQGWFMPILLEVDQKVLKTTIQSKRRFLKVLYVFKLHVYTYLLSFNIPLKKALPYIHLHNLNSFYPIIDALFVWNLLMH